MFGKKQSFLALDIGTGSVRGFGLVRDASGVRTHFCTESAGSPSENITAAADAIERELSARFRKAFVTGNFGIVDSTIGRNSICFPRPRRFSDADVFNAICNSDAAHVADSKILHLIPLQFLVDGNDALNASGAFGSTLEIRFNRISCGGAEAAGIRDALAAACLPAPEFFDPIYMLGRRYHRPGRADVFIDFGKTTTKAGVCKDRGLVLRFDLGIAQDDVTKIIAGRFSMDYDEAERIKLSVLSSRPQGADQYVAADESRPDVARSDIWDVWFEVNRQIAAEIWDRIDLDDFGLFITGRGSNPETINALILENKGSETFVLGEHAIVGSFAKLFRQAFGKIRRRLPAAAARKGGIPILPSVMCWNIGSDYVYKMFAGVGIRWIHCDIMDGFYTQKVMGSLDDIRLIRGKTTLKMQVHLMAEDPMPWIGGVASAGADSIIISTGARRLGESLAKIKKLGRRCGLAIHPDFEIGGLRPEILRMADDIIVMSVVPGESGQKFMLGAPGRIKILANTRRRYGFGYKIMADGGINLETAPLCWAAGADALISGSWLREAPDFADAALKLLPRP
jgi:ribulose-phosphate 3-epimerase